MGIVAFEVFVVVAFEVVVADDVVGIVTVHTFTTVA